MNSSYKRLFVPIFVLFHLFSAGVCVCVLKGKSKLTAECTGVFPDFSIFESYVEHLTIEHDLTLPVKALHASHFSANSFFKYLESVRIHNTTLILVSRNSFKGLKYLEDIDISFNPLLTSFHEEAVSDVTSLKTLSLSGNVELFKTMSGPILASESLEELDVSRCDIETLHKDAFIHLPRLLYLNLAGNKINTIPQSTFWGVHFLQDLDLSENLLKHLPSFMLGNNSDVEILKLRGNPISDIPRDMLYESGEMLLELDLSETAMTSLSVPPLVSLVDLKLGGSLLISLEDLTHLRSLQNLNLSHTKINEVTADAFAGNSGLQTIRLSGNANLSLPIMFNGAFEYLHLVDLSKCNLYYLSPKLFDHMTEIATLNLSRNAFNDSEALGKALSPLYRLNVLDISHNKLRVIGEGDLPENSALTKLLLSGNPLMSPPSLIGTPALTRLDLSHCTLARIHLPAVFRQTPQLRHLSLSGNKLMSLYDLTYLEVDLREDEDSPWKLPQQLAVLDLSDNPWSCDPSFTSLIYKVTEKGVAPTRDPPQRTEHTERLRDIDEEWGRLVDRVCEHLTYDFAITLLPLDVPDTLEGNMSPDFPMWAILSIFMALLMAIAIFLFRLLRVRGNKQQPRVFTAPSMPDSKKVNVSIVVPAGGIKKGTRGKDYQRLHEDRSPGSPQTPRIYKPPKNEHHFTFPDAPAAQDPESCVASSDSTNELPSQSAEP